MSNEWDGKVVMSTPGGPIVTMSLGDLLARKDAEIERLRAENERLQSNNDNLTLECDEARAEVERLRGDAQAISAIAHTGGTAGLSEREALVEIRRRTSKAWDRKTSRAALEASHER